MTATIHPIPLPATPATPRRPYDYFMALGISDSDALWLSGSPRPGPSESLALDLSVADILDRAQR